jgi:DNA invertase Pin-like site-specific DNA recombinase
MMRQAFLAAQTDNLEREIRQDVLEIRQQLTQLGYLLRHIYQEGRDGLIFCALYERAAAASGACVSAYVRVSMYQQSTGHSLVTQLLQMLALAEARGQIITRVYVEAGVSGADSRRPAFQALMRDAVRGDPRAGVPCAAVFCYDLYRFYRNLLGLVSAYNTLDEHGVALVSVAAKDTDLGQLLLYLRGIMGEMYLKDLQRTVRDNKFKRALQGYSNASYPPLGYCRGTCFQC